MGQALGIHLADELNAGRLSAREYKVELLIKGELEKAKRRQEVAQKVSEHRKRSRAAKPDLFDVLPLEVMTEQDSDHLCEASEQCDRLLRDYIGRARLATCSAQLVTCSL